MSESSANQLNDQNIWIKQLTVEIEKMRANLDLATSVKITALMMASIFIALVLYYALRSRLFPLTLYHIYHHGTNESSENGERRVSRLRDDFNDKIRKLEDKIANLEASFQPLTDKLLLMVEKMKARERKLGSGDQLEGKENK